jgi:hypothetical protein
MTNGCFAGIADEDRIRTKQVCVLRYEVLQTTGALFLRALDDQFQIDRHVVAERA